MPFGIGNDYSLYQRAPNEILTVGSKSDDETSSSSSASLFDFTTLFCSWLFGNQVNRIGNNDSILKIKIGYEETFKKGKKHNEKLRSNEITSTKYTLLTFLPVNLCEQFRRIANFYFLAMTIIITLIDSPVSPITSLVPLVFVITVTAAKQGYEDILRHKADNVVNNSLVTVIRRGKEVDIKCQDIQQGDLVIVSKDCDVPCDIVILKSSDPSGKCFVTTANLDGETNLKTLKIPSRLPKLSDNKLHTLGTIECEEPKVDLYSFQGKIIVSPIHKRQISSDINQAQQLDNTLQSNGLEDHDIPLLTDNILLRGSRVKNTDWIIGCAVYVGDNTKMALNSRITRIKVPSSESYINKFLLIILIIQISLVIFCFVMKRYHDVHIIKDHTYLTHSEDVNVVTKFLHDFLSFLVLFNYLIPISLYVTIELNKFLGSFFMEWDNEMYDELTDQPCLVNTSDLIEELGQVNILFSDKTGTLTKNEMYFKECSIKGRKFIYKTTKLRDAAIGTEFDINDFNGDTFTFFQGLAICHTVQVAIKDENEVSFDVQEPKVITFDQIREETPNGDKTGPESEADEVDALKSTTNKLSSDNNPLLKEISSNLSTERPPRPSPLPLRNFRRDLLKRDNSIHPVPESRLNGEHEIPSNLNLNPSIVQLSRPSRTFHRSTSSIDLPNNTPAAKSKHRRTMSYGIQRNFSQADSVTSKSSINSVKRKLSRRESYATPFYTQQSLLFRADSKKRKKEIKSVVEKLDYQSSSPDEKALVEAAAQLGIIYTGDADEEIKIHVYPPHLSSSSSSSLLTMEGKKLSFTRLNVLEFTSERKKMSVIVRDRRNNIWLYTKGAESYVLPLCGKSSPELISKTNDHVNSFARHGLRTLIVARKKLTEEEYNNFAIELNIANTSFENRTELLMQCYAKIESNLHLLGATAVEDALQDYVSDTLISLQAAGVKIWVLTGDKVETALNIALSCGHISEKYSRYFIVECRNETQIREHLRIFDQEIRRSPMKTFALLIDGVSLSRALKFAEKEFCEVSLKCNAVLCCRLSPIQKCKVVKLIKDYRKEYITAAIGDGANDVSMIQEAHVGLGIVGKEGRQAARCADFSFSKFCMLKKLLLVHGHYHTYRLSLLVLYFFYKNIVFMGSQFLFQIHNLFSTESIYDSLFLTFYNVIYTSLPILIISLTEKPFKEDELMRNPKLYMNNIFNKLLRWNRFFSWISFGIFHFLVCFYVTYYIWSYNTAIFSFSPFTVDLSCFGAIIIHNVVVLVNFKLWMESIYQSYLFIGSIIGSIFAFILTTVLYNILTIRYDKDIYWMYNSLLMTVTFWLISFLIIVLGLLPDYCLKVIRALNLENRYLHCVNKMNTKVDVDDNPITSISNYNTNINHGHSNNVTSLRTTAV